MAAIPRLDEINLRAICDILGATSTGLSNAEMETLLRERGIADPVPGITKRHRLFEALVQRQRSDNCANSVLGFVKHVMNPVRYVGNKDAFESQRQRLNGVLSFSGLALGDDGKLRPVKAAQTLNEAEAAASMLRKALIDRSVHADVLKFCRAELLVDNYFHAVFEAAKSGPRNCAKRRVSSQTADPWWMKPLSSARPAIRALPSIRCGPKASAASTRV